MAATQLEPTDARKTFPCFDEPQLKAVFNVKLARKSYMKSLSNMPIINKQNMYVFFVDLQLLYYKFKPLFIV